MSTDGQKEAEVLDVTVLPPEALQVLKLNDIGDGVIATLSGAFSALFYEARKWEVEAGSINVQSIADVAGMKRARELRLRLKNIRVDCEAKRKEMKESSLRTGKAIDGIANVLKALVEPLEKRLEDQEKFLEKEQERINEELRQTRRTELLPFAEIAGYTDQMDLSRLSVKDFENLLASLTAQMDAKKKAEAEAEAERLAQEQARIEAEEKRCAEEKRVREELAKEKEQRELAEKARLEAEAKAEAELKAEQERAERERLEAEAKAKAEREEQAMLAEKAKMEADAKHEEELRLQREAAEAERLAAEQLRADEEKKRLEAEEKLAQILAAEEAEQKRVEKAEADAKKAPDKEKILLFCGEIEKLIERLPTCQTEEGKKAEAEVREKIQAFANWVKRISETI